MVERVAMQPNECAVCNVPLGEDPHIWNPINPLHEFRWLAGMITPGQPCPANVHPICRAAWQEYSRPVDLTWEVQVS